MSDSELDRVGKLYTVAWLLAFGAITLLWINEIIQFWKEIR